MTTSRAWLALTSNAICVTLCYVTLRGMDNPLALCTVLIFIFILFFIFWNINMEKLCGNVKLATEKARFNAMDKNNKK